jgi:hypothetical protein
MASTEVAWTLPEGTRPIDAIGQAQAFRKSAPLGLGWGARTFSSRHRSECRNKKVSRKNKKKEDNETADEKSKNENHEGRALSYIFGTKIQEEGGLSEDKVNLVGMQSR